MTNAAAKTKITVEATVNAPVSKTWKTWTSTEDIVQWNSPSPEWHTPKAQHELKPGGNFSFRMEARDGSMGFDFAGVYDVVKTDDRLEYTLGDGRKVEISFKGEEDGTHIIQTFEAEDMNSVEMQRAGWQAILDSFKNYTEAQ